MPRDDFITYCQILQVGELDFRCIHIVGIFLDRVLHGLTSRVFLLCPDIFLYGSFLFFFSAFITIGFYVFLFAYIHCARLSAYLRMFLSIFFFAMHLLRVSFVMS